MNVSTIERPSMVETGAVAPTAPVSALLIYGFTIFSSAFLLFQVQLVIAKYILPWFGGSPAVFTTSMLFFQLILLLGYGYAHALTFLSWRWQTATHSMVIVVGLALLAWRAATWGSPLLPGSNWKPTGSEHPVLLILALLFSSVALPFFVVSTTGPLVQAWFGRTYQGSPYRWYALSNAGSLASLLTYPVAIEPLLRLRTQAAVWSVGFALFAAACIASAFLSLRRSSRAAEVVVPSPDGADSPAPRWRDRLTWLLLAGCGSLVLLATTNQLCQDVAVVPFLWVLPLSLYLLSFVVCFDSDIRYSRNVWSVGLAIGMLLACFALYHPGTRVVWQIAIYSFVLFACCMVCHGELARLRPGKKCLTSFYVTVAGGGAAGGMFVGIIAPLLFRAFWEFHLGLWLCCVLFLVVLLRDPDSWIHGPKPFLAAYCALFSFFGPVLVLLDARPTVLGVAAVAMLGLFCLMFSGRASASAPAKLAAAKLSATFTACVLCFVLAIPAFAGKLGVLFGTRNFYSTLTVQERNLDSERAARMLVHGKIVHGLQFRSEAKRLQPTAYFSPESGIGVALTNAQARLAGRHLRIGVVGLGAGTLAAYGREGDYMRFYELNPDVARIANGGPKGFFTFIADSPAKVDVVLGDGRISLEQELGRNQAQQFDVLVLDAFSGDAVPVHLLTTEAFSIYLQHLRADGLLAFNITNRSIDLTSVIARLAAQFGRSAWGMTAGDATMEKARSVWILVAPPSGFVPPAGSSFQRVYSDPKFPLWTDDFSNLVSVLKW